MGDLAVAVIVGRLTRDAELKYTNSGQAVCHFSVATNSRVKKGDQWVDEPSYWDIDLWGKRGETINQYLVKGKQVAVQGDMRQDRWEQDGQTRMKVRINANDVQFLESANRQGAPGGSEGRSGGYGSEGRSSYGARPSEERSSGSGYGYREGRSEGRGDGPPPREGPRNAERSPGPNADDFTDDIPF